LSNTVEAKVAVRPADGRLSIAVVIPTRNRPAQLEACLHSLRDQTRQPDQVIVVDSAPVESAENLARKFAALYRIEPISGAAMARNTGAAAARSDIVAFLDDDTIAATDWLCRITAEFEDGAVAAVAGAVLPDGTSAAGSEPLFVGSPDRLEITQHSPSWFEQALFGGVGVSANMACRLSSFRSWGGFRTDIGPGRIISGGEDNYIFFSALRSGCKVIYNPTAIVYHASRPGRFGESAQLRRELPIDAFAYFWLLLLQEGGYRARLLRYGVRSLRRLPPGWRTYAPGSDARASRSAMIGAAFRGAVRCLKSRLHDRNAAALPLQPSPADAQPQPLKCAAGDPESKPARLGA
jgi:glycosyltransferase involved in cell wall biosynthesis